MNKVSQSHAQAEGRPTLLAAVQVSSSHSSISLLLEAEHMSFHPDTFATYSILPDTTGRN